MTTGNGTPWRDAARMRRLYQDEELSTTEIAEKFGCAQKTVYKWLNRHGVDLRSKSEGVQIAASKRSQNEPCYLRTNTNGYEEWEHMYKGDRVFVKAHQLVAISDGADPHEVFGGHHVHHTNELRWDNRPENLEVLTPGEHSLIHGGVLSENGQSDSVGESA